MSVGIAVPLTAGVLTCPPVDSWPNIFLSRLVRCLLVQTIYNNLDLLNIDLNIC